MVIEREKEMNQLDNLGIITKDLAIYSTPVFLVKKRYQILYRRYTNFCVLNDQLITINHASPLVKDCMQIADHET